MRVQVIYDLVYDCTVDVIKYCTLAEDISIDPHLSRAGSMFVIVIACTTINYSVGI